MSNAMKYIRELEAAGFPRNQAEAQVQMILDAVEGDMNIKSELVKINERMNERFASVDKQFVELEFRITTRLGLLVVSTTTIAVAVLAWLIKVQ